MSNKVRFAQEAQTAASIFAKLSDTIAALQAVYWDRGYNSGGADTLTDEDVASIGVTAADVTGMADAFAGALATFLAANRGHLSKMRNDL